MLMPEAAQIRQSDYLSYPIVRQQVARVCGSESARDLDEWIKTQKGDREGKLYDSDLARVLLSRGLTRRQKKAIRDAKEDASCTKSFLHREETMDNLTHFLQPQVASFAWNEHYKWAVETVSRMVSNACGHLTPWEIGENTDVKEMFSNPSASAGSIMAKKHKEDVAELTLHVALAFKTMIAEAPNDRELWRKVWLPVLPFHRSQISGYTDGEDYTPSTLEMKDRLVLCVDAATVLIESQYANPLIRALAARLPQYAGGKDNRAIQYQLVVKGKTKNYISLDFSKFDQTVPSWLIRSIFDDILAPLFPVGCARELRWIRDTFTNAHIMQYDGSVIIKHRGVTSGSNFTQIVGTLANIIIILTYLHSVYGNDLLYELAPRSGPRSTWEHPEWFMTMMAMGDDNIIFTRDEVNLVSLSSYVKRNFGMKISTTKKAEGGIGSRPTFLKRQWSNHGEYRNVLDLFINCLHPEWKRKYDTYSPWHIAYGLYLTYEGTFRELGWREEDIIDQMKKSKFGLSALKDVPVRDLPGALRGTAYQSRLDMYERAREYVGA